MTDTVAGAVVPFGDLVAERVARRESQIVLGLDPDPTELWPSALAAAPDDAAPAARAAAAVLAHCRELIDAAGPACVATKAQLACFERLGAPGWKALAAVVEYARAAGLLVLADGKRGDVPVSARAYAAAFFGAAATPFGELPGLRVDALTISPLLGADALEPFIDSARDAGGGVFALVRTSNPGAADVQDLELAGGGRVWERLAELVARLGAPGVGDSGLSDVGAVVGATAPQHIARMRTLMPRAIFLLPGVGAQGGRVEELAPAFAPGPAGALIAASRAIACAYRETDGDPGSAARDQAERLRAAAWSLA